MFDIEIDAGRGLTEEGAEGLSDDDIVLIGVVGGLGGLLVLAACFLSFIPAGLVGVWFKVKFASTDPGSRCFYLPRETKAWYKAKLAEQPPGCCAFSRPAGAPKAADRSTPRDIEGGDDPAAPEKTISGKALGIVPPATPSSSAFSLEKVREDYHQNTHHVLRHHRTTMLPLDLDGDALAKVAATCGFVGFGAADSHDDAVAPGSRSTSEDSLHGPPAPFLFALLNDRGGWMVDVPLTTDGLLLGKHTQIGRGTKLGEADVGPFKDSWFRGALAAEQVAVAVDGGNVVSATRLGPNAAYLQRATGVTHAPPHALPKGEPAALEPGDILWLCRAHYALRLIERLPGPFFQARPMTGGGAQASSVGGGSSVGAPVAEASTEAQPVGVAGAGASDFLSPRANAASASSLT